MFIFDCEYFLKFKNAYDFKSVKGIKSYEWKFRISKSVNPVFPNKRKSIATALIYTGEFISFDITAFVASACYFDPVIATYSNEAKYQMVVRDT